MTTYFGPHHPLAEVAMRLCDAHYALLDEHQVACGPCWETAIRNDERVVAEYGLPREATADAEHVDEIAVERAARGERVSLTAAELRAAAELLRTRRMHPIEIGRRLHITYRAAVAVLGTPGASDRDPHAA
jgi:hypothetical protein